MPKEQKKEQKSTIDWFYWPLVRDTDRPKKLYHASILTEKEVQYLNTAGWCPVDVRLLPDTTIEDRREAILAWLSGIRVGSIIPEQGTAKFIELEMRACGLHAGKTTIEKKGEIDEEDLESILNFGKR